MQGLHLTADLHGCACDARWLTDAPALGAACVQAVRASGLQAVAELFHAFPDTAHGPGGVTATVLLAESHLCVHTWPEQRAVTLDVYVCNFGADQSARAHALMAALRALFQPARVASHALQRGEIAPVGSRGAGAMILAAGRGERMRPLTDTTPKPLLPVRGQPLMQWPMAALARAGVRDQLVNTAWLGAAIAARFGDAPSLGDAGPVHLRYSHEGRDFGRALETAGGIVRALPALTDPFWVVAGDVFVPGFPFDPAAVERFAASGRLAHLWLVPNPPHHPRGDFGLSPEGLALNPPADDPRPRHTFSTIALYRHALFAPPLCDIPPGNPEGIAAPLAPLLRAAMDRGLVSAELWTGEWTDVGTPERLAALNNRP